MSAGNFVKLPRRTADARWTRGGPAIITRNTPSCERILMRHCTWRVRTAHRRGEGRVCRAWCLRSLSRQSSHSSHFVLMCGRFSISFTFFPDFSFFIFIYDYRPGCRVRGADSSDLYEEAIHIPYYNIVSRRTLLALLPQLLHPGAVYFGRRSTAARWMSIVSHVLKNVCRASAALRATASRRARAAPAPDPMRTAALAREEEMEERGEERAVSNCHPVAHKSLRQRPEEGCSERVRGRPAGRHHLKSG